MNKESLRPNSGLSALRSRSGSIHVARTLWRRLVAEGLDRCATAYWRSAGVQMGRNCRIQRGVWIDSPRFVKMGDRCLVQSGAVFMAELLGQPLAMGDDVHINHDVTLDHSGPLSIGHRTLISEGSILYTHSHGHDPHSKPDPHPLEIGSDVWIGMQCAVLPGTSSIGDSSVIGACSVVQRPIAEGSVVSGNPARQISGPHE